MAVIEKQYIYKVYENNNFISTLPYATSDFTYSQDINTGGAQLILDLGMSVESAGITIDSDYLVDSTGKHIIDQNGNRIITRKDYTFTAVPINLGNKLEVWVYDDNLPNGRIVFSGIITKWKTNEANASIQITALSYGVQLDNYMVAVAPNSSVVSQMKYSTIDSLYAWLYKSGSVYNRTVKIAQTFQVATATSIKGMQLVLSKPASLASTVWATATLYSGSPADVMTSISSVQRSVANTSLDTMTFNLPENTSLAANTTYTIELVCFGGSDVSINVARDAAGSNVTSQAYAYNDLTGGYSTVLGDYSFSVITSSGSLGNQFNSYDPSDMLRSVITNFNTFGGKVAYDSTTIDSTGAVASYTFKFNTVQEAINKILQLAPARWYWFVDVGTNLLHFHAQSSSVNHTFTRGKHVEDLDIEYSIEGVMNQVYFSGGDDGTGTSTNIFSSNANPASSSRYGQWIDKLSDNRVIRQDTADLIVTNVLGENSLPRFSTTLTLLEGIYDIESVNLGDIVAFNNFNALINDLRLQVVSVTRTPYSIKVRCDTLPPTQSHRIEDIKRNLEDQQTIDNPGI